MWKSDRVGTLAERNLLTHVKKVAAFNQQAQVVSRVVDLIVPWLNTRQSGRNEWSLDSNIEPFQPSALCPTPPLPCPAYVSVSVPCRPPEWLTILTSLSWRETSKYYIILYWRILDVYGKVISSTLTPRNQKWASPRGKENFLFGVLPPLKDIRYLFVIPSS